MTSEMMPKVNGVGRDAEHDRCLVTYFDTVPTDDQMRYFHEHVRAWNARPPAPAAGELAALAEAWVEAAEYHQQLAREMPGMLDEHKLGLACADAQERKEIARAAFHTALSAHLAEVRAAIGPFVRLHKKQDEIYRRRGGNPDAFPDTHPAYDISARELPVGVWRRLGALAKKLEG